MSIQPNHSIPIASESQVSTTINTATGEEINPEQAEYVVPAYDSTKNCSFFLSSILPDDDSYIQILLAMLSPIDSHLQECVNDLVSSKVLTNKKRQRPHLII